MSAGRKYFFLFFILTTSSLLKSSSGIGFYGDPWKDERIALFGQFSEYPGNSNHLTHEILGDEVVFSPSTNILHIIPANHPRSRAAQESIAQFVITKDGRLANWEGKEGISMKDDELYCYGKALLREQLVKMTSFALKIFSSTNVASIPNKSCFENSYVICAHSIWLTINSLGSQTYPDDSNSLAGSDVSILPSGRAPLNFFDVVNPVREGQNQYSHALLIYGPHGSSRLVFPGDTAVIQQPHLSIRFFGCGVIGVTKNRVSVVILSGERARSRYATPGYKFNAIRVNHKVLCVSHFAVATSGELKNSYKNHLLHYLLHDHASLLSGISTVDVPLDENEFIVCAVIKT